MARSGPEGHIGVFTLDTLAQVGEISGTSAHGAAVDTATGRGFATSNPVAMFDAQTFAVLKKIDVQGHPDGYLNDPYNHRFYVLSHAEPNITVLDDKDASILSTINIGGAPEQAASDGRGKIYVDIVDKAAIAVIDATTMKMSANTMFPAAVVDVPASHSRQRTTFSLLRVAKSVLGTEKLGPSLPRYTNNLAGTNYRAGQTVIRHNRPHRRQFPAETGNPSVFLSPR